MKRFIIFIIIAITFIGQSGAQTVDLTNEEIEVIKSRIVNKLEDFQYFLGIIADKRNSTNVRQNALNSNINLIYRKM